MKPGSGGDPSQGLGRLLDEAIEAATEFVPECEREYTVHVYCRLLVADCARITESEERAMSDCLVRKGRRAARDVCSLNSDCPNGRLLRYRFDRIECENRLWEVDLSWIFRCEA